MPFDQWIAFAAASAVVLVSPGPTVVLVMTYALTHGRRSAIATSAGVALGDLTAMSASLLGLGALMLASATLFTAVKWVGAVYLVYLGVTMWRAPADLAETRAVTSASPWRMLLHAYGVTALNPQSIVFFVAFVPQFLDPASPPASQMLILLATFVTLAAINAFAYAMLAATARRAIRRPAVLRAANWLGGSALIAAAVLTLLWKRQAA